MNRGSLHLSRFRPQGRVRAGLAALSDLTFVRRRPRTKVMGNRSSAIIATADPEPPRRFEMDIQTSRYSALVAERQAGWTITPAQPAAREAGFRQTGSTRTPLRRRARMSRRIVAYGHTEDGPGPFPARIAERGPRLIEENTLQSPAASRCLGSGEQLSGPARSTGDRLTAENARGIGPAGHHCRSHGGVLLALQ